jgi:hypothetical protein
MSHFIKKAQVMYLSLATSSCLNLQNSLQIIHTNLFLDSLCGSVLDKPRQEGAGGGSVYHFGRFLANCVI